MKTIADIKEELHRTIELAQAATAGPWAKDWGRVRGNQCESICDVPGPNNFDSKPWVHDAAHIANSANLSVPMARALLAAIEDYEALERDTAGAGIHGLLRITEAWQ